MVHHYSWVRTQEECLQKARTWGHRNERDWPLLIERAFHGDAGSLFDPPLEFEKIESAYFDPFAVHVPRGAPSQKKFSNVLCVNHNDVFKRELACI